MEVEGRVTMEGESPGTIGKWEELLQPWHSAVQPPPYSTARGDTSQKNLERETQACSLKLKKILRSDMAELSWSFH